MKNRKRHFVLLLTPFLTSLAAGTTLADHRDPVGYCPPRWKLHHFMAHEDHHEHHVGLTVDLNDDGYICVLHTAPGKHVHVDNYVPK